MSIAESIHRLSQTSKEFEVLPLLMRATVFALAFVAAYAATRSTEPNRTAVRLRSAPPRERAAPPRGSPTALPIPLDELERGLPRAEPRSADAVIWGRVRDHPGRGFANVTVQAWPVLSQPPLDRDLPPLEELVRNASGNGSGGALSLAR